MMIGDVQVGDIITFNADTTNEYCLVVFKDTLPSAQKMLTLHLLMSLDGELIVSAYSACSQVEKL